MVKRLINHKGDSLRNRYIECCCQRCSHGQQGSGFYENRIFEIKCSPEM